MKLTPFILFLILLFVLVISIVFSRFLPIINSKEGFISFKKDTNSLNYVYIPQYSTQTSTSNSTVVKLYDNLFFDTKNSNIIEVNGSAYVGNSSSSSSSTDGNVDSLGVSITGVYVVKRDGSKNTNPYTTVLSSDNKVIAKDTEESKISTIPTSNQSWVYNTLSTNTDKYQLFYISWNKDTYVHVINLTNSRHMTSFMFSTNNIMKQKNYPSDISISLSNYTQDNDQNNNKKIKISNYANELYQVSKNVKFDCSSGNLIITDETSTSTDYQLYGRNGEFKSVHPTTLPTSVPNSDFTPFIMSDSFSSTGKNMVLYLPDGQNTVIALIYMDPTTNLFKFGNVVRFSSKGVDNNNNVSTSTDNVTISTDNVNSDYYKWLAYWNTSVANNPGNMNQKIDFNDYMLKTQIVPPVCPTCPSCPSSSGSCSGGVCTNCGGQGGSGTKINNENLGIADATANIAQTGGGVINNTVDNITGLGIGAEVLAAGAGIGAYNLLSNAGGGATDLVKSAGSGILSLGKDQQGGYNSGYAANGYRGSGAGYNTGVGAGAGYNTGVGAGAGYNTGVGSGAGYNTGVGAGAGPGAGTGADYYSYYGALPNKKSNFIPVTADFSSFSK